MKYNLVIAQKPSVAQSISKVIECNIVKQIHFYKYNASYCSYERGSNENNNKLIRRFIEKGVDIGKFSKKRIQEIENFMNNYPRKMFDGLSSNEVYRLTYEKL